MKKTPKMLEVEESIGEPLQDYLKREYVDKRMNTYEIGKKLGLTARCINNWLKEDGIEVRDRSEARLPEGGVKPTKEELEKMYIDEKMSTLAIGKKLGISNTAVTRWLKRYGIKIRDRSEVILFLKGITRPSKEELEKMYIDEKMSTLVIGKKVGVASSVVYIWLKKDGIKLRSNSYMTDTQFREFLQKNESARNLAGSALLVGGGGNDIESIIIQAYSGTFKNKEELHSLLENNRQEIYDLVKEGLTNLGQYIGDFSLDERTIIPVLIGQAISTIDGNKITAQLEERLVGILKTQYSPRFNDNPEGTLSKLERTIGQYEGKVKEIYKKLYVHYREVMKLQKELQ